MNDQNKKETPMLYKKPAFDVYNQEHTFISLEKAFEYVGDNSSYQKRVIVVLSFQWIFYSFMTMGLPFMVFSQNGSCLGRSQAEGIVGWNTLIDWTKITSIANDFGLLCENKQRLTLVMSIFYIGSCFSGLVFPSLADNFGRKYIMIIAILLGASSIIIVSLTQNLDVLLLALFSAGFFLNGYETICLVYVTEISARRFKNFSTVTLMSVWALSQIIFALLSQQVHNWRTIMLFIISLPMLISVLPMIYYLDETPKHLVQIREYNKATNVLKKISMTNNRPPFRFHLIGEIPQYNRDVSQAPLLPAKASRKGQQMNKNLKTIKDITMNAKGYLDLIIERKLRNRTLLLLYIWFIRYYVYFGIQFSLAQYDDFYLSLIFTACGEVVANLIGAPIKLKVKRRTSLSFCLVLMIICSVVLSKLKTQTTCEGSMCLQQDIETVCATLLKFGITIYIAILITYTSESYPTAMRAKAYGLCMTFGKIGSVVVPIQINQLNAQHINPLSYVWLSCGFTLICIYYLPETQKENVLNECLESDPEDDDQHQQIIQIEMKKKENHKYVPGTD